MSSTPRLGVPLLSPGQAQKEFFHNEALQTFDTLVAAASEEPPRASPPTAPALGACYIIADSPTGAWTGKAQCIAAFTSGGWRFITPFEGVTVYIRSTSTCAAYRAGAWEVGVLRGTNIVLGGQQVVGSRLAAISSASGGTTVDSQARSVIDQILAAMRQHGLIET
jgi:uncharacterized protein DUF2793